jgi:hypothetical protein
VVDDSKWAGHGPLNCVSRLERITSRFVDLSWPTDGARVALPGREASRAVGVRYDRRGIIEDFPDLGRHDLLLAALEFGALVSGQRRLVLLGAA